MKNVKHILFAILMAMPCFLLAQGTISGTVIDANNGETLIGANVIIEGTTTGTSTDFDGKYQFKADPGSYTILVSYIGYQDKKITEVEVEDGEITYLDITVSDGAVELDLDVTVKAKAIERSENALLLLQRKSEKIQDGISAQEMSKMAVSNAAGAVGKVSGATVRDGKYIYIRGLGDRYSLSQLNGLVIPSTDPYRNSAQLDLIPAGLLDNIITSKTFTPDQPGSFTGGNVNIKTKSFPEQFSLTVSLTTGFNAQNNLSNDFLTHTGGDLDWLGYDDGTRDHPDFLRDSSTIAVLNRNSTIISRLGRDDSEQVATTADRAIKSLDNNFTPDTVSMPLDHGVSISFGNQYQIGGNPLGVIAALSYKRNYTNLANFRKANWILEDLSTGTLDNQGDFQDSRSIESPTVNGMFGLAYKFSNTNSVDFKVLYNHNTNKTTRFVFGEQPDNITDPFFLQGRGLIFNERALLNYQLGGEHAFPSLNDAKIEWKVSSTESSMNEPNSRFFLNRVDRNTGFTDIPATDVIRPFYFFRRLDDEQQDAKIDFTIPFTDNKANKIKFGAMYTNKDRQFNEDRYQIEQFQGQGFAGDVDAYLAEDNIGIVREEENNRFFLGNYIERRTSPDNQYTGSSKIAAAYAMVSYGITEELKFVGGARYENTDLFVESDAFSRPDSLRIGEIKEGDILPSANLIYGLNEKMNLRASYSKTLARPNMREIAPFVSFDPLTNEFFFGNPKLEMTDIQNFDLRWEYFINPGEILSVSTYYKRFTNPITRIYRRAPQPELQFDNVRSGELYGLEFEFRKKLGFIAPVLKDFKFNTNVSVIYSQLDVLKLTEFEPDDRPFEGQSPLIVNASLSYFNEPSDFEATIVYNYLGDRLNIIGREGTPDIYDRARSQLDVNVTKKINNIRLSLSAKNLLDSPFKLSSEYLGEEFVYQEFQRGITYRLGLSYTFK